MIRRLSVHGLLLVIMAIACSDETPVGPALDPQLANGPENGFAVVLVRANAPPQAQGALVNNLADAVARVRAGGTIRVFDGTYVVEGLELKKAVTIEAASGTRPVIRNPGADASFFVSGFESGTLTFRGLAFEVDGWSGVYVSRTYGEVVIENCGFSMGDAATTGVFGSASSVAGASVLVQRSTFAGGLSGVFFDGRQEETELAANGRSIHVLSSQFSDHSFSGIQYQGGASGRIEGNTVERCGPNGCIRAINAGEVEIVGNDVRNEVGREVGWGIRAFRGGSVTITDNLVVGSGDGDAFGAGVEVVRAAEAVVRENRVSGANRGIQFFAVPVGRIQNNLIDPCGAWNCIGVENGGQDVVVSGNTVRSTLARRTFFAIQAGWPAGSGSLVITDNDIQGMGAPADPNDRSTYPLQFAFLNLAWQTLGEEGVPLGPPVVFSRNRISNAGSGVNVLQGGVTEGRDNTFTTVHGPIFSAHDRGINRLRFNDVNGYIQSIVGSPVADEPHLGILEVTCNYWGGAAPRNVDIIVPAGAYTPWATSPVAGTGATTCDGGT